MKSQSVTKHLLEVRYQPLPIFLDKKGAITESLLNNVFDNWTVNPTRIDIASMNNKNIACYVTYTNYGLISEAPNTTELFIEQAQELVKKIWTIIPSNRTQRIGVRTYQYFSDKRSFDELLKRYQSQFLSVQDKKLRSFNGKLIDIGIALNFAGKENAKFNMNTGAMQQEQAKQFFTDTASLPEVGIFTDTDFFNENPSQLASLKQRDFLELLTQGVEKARVVQEIVTDILNDNNDK